MLLIKKKKKKISVKTTLSPQHVPLTEAFEDSELMAFGMYWDWSPKIAGFVSEIDPAVHDFLFRPDFWSFGVNVHMIH